MAARSKPPVRFRGDDMARYERGCVKYLTVEYPLQISFPEEKVFCDLCPFCHTENSGTRFRCVQTGEILPFHNVDYGMRCPLPIPERKINKGEDEE